VRPSIVELSTSLWKEECGVTGVFCTGDADGKASASPLVHIALYALQHRGQESAGIAALDGERITLHRGMRLPLCEIATGPHGEGTTNGCAFSMRADPIVA